MNVTGSTSMLTYYLSSFDLSIESPATFVIDLTHTLYSINEGLVLCWSMKLRTYKVNPALIVIDVQNGFVSKGGSYDLLGLDTTNYRACYCNHP